MQPFQRKMHLDTMFANIVGYCGQDVKWKITTGGNEGKEAMKHRSIQLGVRKNPDSPRVHGLRLAADSSSSRSGSQNGNSPESKPSPSAERLGLPFASSREPHQTPEPVWHCAEAARFLRLHPKTVKRMACAGQIPGCRLGRRWCFRPSDLDALLRTGVNFSAKANRVAPQLSSNPKRRA
jgi:excisionase family DNA binding protein